MSWAHFRTAFKVKFIHWAHDTSQRSIIINSLPPPSFTSRSYVSKLLCGDVVLLIYSNQIEQIIFSYILMIISIMSSSPTVHVIQFRETNFDLYMRVSIYVCAHERAITISFFVDEHFRRQLHEDMDCNVNLYLSVNYVHLSWF